MTGPRPHSTAWLRAALLALLALVLSLAAAGRSPVDARAASAASKAAISAGKAHGSVEAAAPRAEPQLRRDNGSFQELLQPVATWSGARRSSPHWPGPNAIGPGFELPRDRHVAHFRRRIPRLSSEEPPWC